MNFREMRAKLIRTYGRFVFFPQDPEIPKIVSTRAFTHLIIDDEITIYAPHIMEEQLESELAENYNVIYDEPKLSGTYYVSPQTAVSNLNFNWLRGDIILKKALRKPFEEELDILREAAHMVSKGLEQFWESLKLGMTEQKAAAMLDSALREQGISGFTYPTIVVAGEKSKYPAPSTGSGKIEEGKLVYIDVAPEYLGYSLNLSRVIFTEDRQDWIEALDRINSMYENLAPVLKAGTELNLIDTKIRTVGNFPHYSVVPAGGFYQPFAPGAGILEENMVLTVVPSIYLPDGIIRVKKTVITGYSGPEVLV